jgi:hypothetical protein
MLATAKAAVAILGLAEHQAFYLSHMTNRSRMFTSL